MPTTVSDTRSNSNDQIAHAARVLKGSTHRQAVFEAICSGRAKVKSVDEIAKTTKLSRKQVLTAGKNLVDNHLFSQIKKNGDTAYEKDPFYATNKNRILKFAKNPADLKKLPTKTNPGFQSMTFTIIQRASKGRIKAITVDDIHSFRRVRKVGSLDPTKVPEAKFKKGIQTIIGDQGVFKDWGGERNDLWTTKLVLSTTRKATAFAFKGPGTSGKLTPNKMGKNGDQIQRLFEAPAEVFVLQYWNQIMESVVVQMETFAKVKAIADGRTVYYCVIDGTDSSRLVAAYPDAFT